MVRRVSSRPASGSARSHADLAVAPRLRLPRGCGCAPLGRGVVESTAVEGGPS